jgi:hypothetical protein
MIALPFELVILVVAAAYTLGYIIGRLPRKYGP